MKALQKQGLQTARLASSLQRETTHSLVFLVFTGVQLLCRIVLVSAVRQRSRASQPSMYTCSLCQPRSLRRGPVLCSRFPQLFILHMIVYLCHVLWNDAEHQEVVKFIFQVPNLKTSMYAFHFKRVKLKMLLWRASFFIWKITHFRNGVR